jgi:hypothetical protein
VRDIRAVLLLVQASKPGMLLDAPRPICYKNFFAPAHGSTLCGALIPQ